MGLDCPDLNFTTVSYKIVPFFSDHKSRGAAEGAAPTSLEIAQMSLVIIYFFLDYSVK